MVSVVIPAHNEARSIVRCLETLLGSKEPEDLDVVVVCNGCSDNTETLARRFQPAVQVASIDVASKVAALRTGDRLARGFPRLYLDADVEFSGTAVRKLCEPLANGSYLAAAPNFTLDSDATSRLVRRYYAVWSRLPSIRHGLAGRGAYALSAAGRSRFGEFPDIMADDYFIDSLFRPGEIYVDSGLHSVVRPPKTVRALMARRARVYAGNARLELVDDSAAAHRSRRSGQLLTVVREDPGLVASIFIFAGLNAAVRARLAYQARRGREIRWGHDRSSR